MLTSNGCQFPSADPQLMGGAFLSTRLPPSGPAVVEFPTASVRVCVPVCALFVSVPAETFVDSENEADELRPEPPSAAVQLRVTSLADQVVGAGSHVNVGPFL